MYYQPDFQSLPTSVGHSSYRPQLNRSLSNRPIVLDDYNSDLNFKVEQDGLTGSSLYQDGFEYMWAGARGTHGIKQGKACFQVHIMEKLPVKMADTEQSPHVARVGWSTDDSGLLVGEDQLSYGYGGTGKSSVNNRFFDYGEPYSVNDVISCYIDLDKKCIFFCKNGHFLGVAFELNDVPNGNAFYPHVSIKNMKIQVNFGLYQPTFPPVEGFSMIQQIHKDLLVRGMCGPDTRSDSKVIMMVGLPASGKTYWANEYTRENKDLRFNIIGTNVIMDKMKVTGLARSRNYHGRWDQLIQKANVIQNKMLEIAEKKNRNYIIDQTNVYDSARRRKMGRFRGFKRIAAVIVNTNEVLKIRSEKREKEEGKIVPEKAVMQMKSNFTLPEVGESFDDVWFLEEDHANSTQLCEEFRQEGKAYTENERANDPQAFQTSQATGGPSQTHQHSQHYPSTGDRPQDTQPPHGASSSLPPIPGDPRSPYRGASRFLPHPRYSPHPYNNGTNRHEDYYTPQYASVSSHGQYRHQPHPYNSNYNPYGNRNNVPVQDSLPPGCSPYVSFTSDAYRSLREAQEHEYPGAYRRCDQHRGCQQYDSTQRNQEYPPYHRHDGGHSL